MTQPEALRLADLLLSENAMDCLEHSDDAATELRRLHEENKALRQALAQPEQGNSSPNYPNTESNTPFVDAVNMSQKRVDEMAKYRHEPWCDSVTKLLLSLPPQIPPCNCKPKREWVGLTDEEFKRFSFNAPWEIVQEIEAKLKEKNT